MDGHQQRQALSAAERSLEHLASGRHDDARRAAARAAELDQVEAFAGLPDALGHVADDIERQQQITMEHFRALEAVIGPGPLAALLEPLRARISSS